MAKYKKFYGFTLIELLIVIAILGILVAAVMSSVNPAKRQKQAKDSKIKSDIGQIATALSAYYTGVGSGSYPDVLTKLVNNSDLKSLPLPPQGTGTSYQYAKNPTGCTGVIPLECTDVATYLSLQDPQTSGNVWCWRSSTGKAEEIAPASCTAP